MLDRAGSGPARSAIGVIERNSREASFTAWSDAGDIHPPTDRRRRRRRAASAPSTPPSWSRSIRRRLPRRPKRRREAEDRRRRVHATCRPRGGRSGAAVDEEMKAGGVGASRSDLRRETEASWARRSPTPGGQNSIPTRATGGPPAFVWTKAPKIIDFFSSSKIITPLGEAFAIPTENVPRGARGKRLSPIEVEARFNAELQPVKLPSGRIGLVIDVVAGSTAAVSRARPKRSASRGRSSRSRC
jgi:hypothetical protein